MTKLSKEKTFPLLTIFYKPLKFSLFLFKSFAGNSNEYAKFFSRKPQTLSLH